MKKNFTVLTLAFFGGTCALFGADPLDDLKKFSADGLGGPAAVTAPAGFSSCEQAALAPLGSFIPGPFTVTVPGFTVGGVPFTNPAVTLTLPTAAFLLPAPRLCVLSASGASQHDPPGKSQFTLNLSIDAATYRGNGSMGGCAQASGSLSFVKTDNGAANDTVNMRVAGLYCDVAGITSTKVFTGAYNIDGGTRKFAGAAGTGNIAFSFAGQTLLHADGNILSAK